MAGLVANPNNLNITGARVSLVIGGQVIGYARSCSMSYAIDYQENRVLNSLRVESHSPVSYRCTLSFSMFRIPKQTVTTLGFFPKTGNTVSDQLANVLTIPEMTAVITDQVTGTALYTAIGVRIASNSVAFDAGGSVVGTEVDCVCRAIYSEDELSPAA
jgi:hypothetical protein